MAEVEKILEDLYNFGSYDEEFPIDPDKDRRLEIAKLQLKKLVESKKNMLPLECKYEREAPLLREVHNNAIDEVMRMFE